jgi:MFS transporter, DHA2 family, multidrug resistance protein
MLVTVTVMLGLIMAIIDSSIVNVALDTMAGNLGASIDEISWVATSYILANVVIMPLNGWLTGYFGRKKFYAACVAIFTVASFLCGTATNVWQLVAYRILQGLGGGALQPTAQAILFESYPPEKRGQAMAVFGLGAMVGPTLGPTLGGYIVDNASWPLIFYINLPIGVIAFLMTLAFIRDPSYIAKPERGIDWFGLGMMTAGIAALQYVLERGQHDDWFDSPAIVILSVVAIAGIIGFLVRELAEKQPFVDLRVFKNRAFAAGNIIGVVTGFGLFGLNLILPLYFQDVLRFNAWQSGLALLPGAAATALSMPVAGRLNNKVDPRWMIALGLTMFGVSSWLMGDWNQNIGYWDIFWPRFVQGFSMGFLFVPLSTATLSSIERGQLANATGLYTLVRQLGGSLGIAILTTLLQRHGAAVQQGLGAGIDMSNPSVRVFLADPSTRAAHLAQLYAMVQQNAVAITYNYLFRLSGLLFLISIPTVFLLGSHRRNAAAPETVIPE